MQRLALALGFAAVIAAMRPAPGQLFAIGLGLAAIGTGWVAYRRRATPGLARLAGAAAMTLGALGFTLGATRFVLALVAIGRLADRL
jgi:hypothetical protein